METFQESPAAWGTWVGHIGPVAWLAGGIWWQPAVLKIFPLTSGKLLQQGIQVLQCHCDRAKKFAALSKWVCNRSKQGDFMKASRSYYLK